MKVAVLKAEYLERSKGDESAAILALEAYADGLEAFAEAMDRKTGDDEDDEDGDAERRGFAELIARLRQEVMRYRVRKCGLVA